MHLVFFYQDKAAIERTPLKIKVKSNRKRTAESRANKTLNKKYKKKQK